SRPSCATRSAARSIGAPRTDTSGARPGSEPAGPRPTASGGTSARGVLLAREDAGHMRGVGGECRGGRRHGGWRLVEILVVLGVHGLVVPVRAALRRDGEPDVVESLEGVGDDLVGAVLVAHHRHYSRLAEHRGTALVVRG